MLLITAAAINAQAAEVELEISDSVINKGPGCADYLRDAVHRIRFPENIGPTKLHVGHYDELSNLLVKAGMPKVEADRLAPSLSELHAVTFNYQSMKFTAQFLRHLVSQNAIYLCVISKQCRLASLERNLVSFTPRNEIMVFFPPAQRG